jgi:subtilisin family serine protease
MNKNSLIIRQKEALFLFLIIFFILPVNILFAEDIKNNKSLHNEAYVEGQVIIKFKHTFKQSVQSLNQEQKKQRVIQEIESVGVKYKKIHHLGNETYLIKLQEDKENDVNNAVRKLKNNKNIETTEPNYLYKLSALPNDPNWSYLWGLQKIQAPQAWDVTTGSSNVVVVVIDSGIDYTHEDLATNIWINSQEVPGDGIDNDNDGYIDDVYGIAPVCGAYSDKSVCSDIMDDWGHGTHVSGIIGAGGNNGVGGVGVNWSVKLLGCKACSKIIGGCPLSATLKCYNYIATMKDRGVNIKAVNESLSGNYSQLEYEAINNLRSKGILVVAAAGNNSYNNDYSPCYPCNYNIDNVICVASTDANDNLSYFSNYGMTVHVAAPGESILSSVNNDSDTQSGVSVIFSDDFESGLANWSVPQGAGLSEKYYKSPTHSISTSPDSNYSDNIPINLLSNQINLSSYKNQKVFFDFYIYPAVSSGDKLGYAIMWEQGKATYANFDGGYLSPVWYYSGVYYIPTDFRQNNSQISFFLNPNNDGITNEGFFVDNVRVFSVSSQTNTYEYMSGTSMATPFVTGLAALIWAKEPNLSYLDVKNRILSSVDVIAGLNGKVKTSGRINAYRALNPNTIFLDVPSNNWAYPFIQTIYNKGITSGCSKTPPLYCPSNTVTRAEVSAFIIKSIYGANPVCQNGIQCSFTTPYFNDVFSSDWYFGYVQKMKEQNITSGCGSNSFCPYMSIDRAQLAVFLVKAKLGTDTFSYIQTPYFIDVPQNHWAFKYIQKLKELGITSGYPDGTYKPANVVRRDEMAAFLVRAFFQ